MPRPASPAIATSTMRDQDRWTRVAHEDERPDPPAGLSLVPPHRDAVTYSLRRFGGRFSLGLVIATELVVRIGGGLGSLSRCGERAESRRLFSSDLRRDEDGRARRPRSDGAGSSRARADLRAGANRSCAHSWLIAAVVSRPDSQYGRSPRRARRDDGRAKHFLELLPARSSRTGFSPRRSERERKYTTNPASSQELFLQCVVANLTENRDLSTWRTASP